MPFQYKKLFLVILFYGIVCSYAKNYSDLTKDSLFISEIIIQGNDLTKEKIILRELMFTIYDKIDSLDLDKLVKLSEENLLNTSLFNFVTIKYDFKDDNDLQINIYVQERWYIWPYPILEHADRNFSSFIKNKEWSRVDYGLFLLINNFRGRKEILKLKTIFGYNNSFVIHYTKPYIDKKQSLGFGFEWNYFRNHELPYQIMDDELLYLKLTDKYAGETTNISAFLIYRPYMFTNHLLNIKYAKVSINDSLFMLNPEYFLNKSNEFSSLSLDYVFKYDKRDSKVYPLKGIHFVGTVNKTGLGILTNKGLFSLRAIFEENVKLSDKFYINTGIEAKKGFGNENSFYFNEAIGFENYIRGMEYYAFHGTDYYISKSNLKFELLPQSEFNMNFIPSKKFSKAHCALYINLFFDTGYVNSELNVNNKLVNEFIFGGGIGLDLVTYYDKVLRIEYSLNKFGEHGLFLHLGAPLIED